MKKAVKHITHWSGLAILTLLLMTTFITNIKAQDIGKIIKADSVAKSFIQKAASSPLELNGQVTAKAMLYAGSAKSEPFTYLLNGNIGFKFMDYTMPLSFNYTNKGISYSASNPLKFNRFNFNPKYKWVHLYFGATSMSFSPYTLGGAQFRGVGAEFSPKGAFSGSLMYGKFYDAVAFNPEKVTVKPVFKRTGYALKLAFKKEKVQMETSLLSATDHPNSIVLPPDSLFSLAALQNVAVNFKSRFSPLKAVNLDIEYATSAVNYRMLYKKEDFFDLLLSNKPGISRYGAYKLNLNFTPGNFMFGGSIEHIDPDYTTLGAYYSKNDFQNITLNTTGSLFKNKLSIMLSGGMENDNLKNQKQMKNTRTVGSASLNFMPSEKWNLNLNYSNFQSFSNLKNQFDYINEGTPFDNLDTLNYSQVNQNASANLIFRVKSSETEIQLINLMGNLNRTSGFEGDSASTPVNYISFNGNWSLSKPKNKVMMAAGINSSLNLSEKNNVLIWGPVISISAPLLATKMQTNLSLAYNQSFLNNNVQQSNFNVRGTVDYSLNEIHKFRLEMALLFRKVNDKPMVSDLRLTLSYILSFKKKQVYIDQIKETISHLK